MAVPGFAQSHGAANETAESKSPAPEYIGSAACAECHQEIYSKYSRTGMGRSMSLVTHEFLKVWPSSGALDDKNTGLHFDVYAREAHLFQSEYQLDPKGQEIFRHTRELEWIIGAGENGFGGLVRNGEYLFQAPLSFYTSWATPGSIVQFCRAASLVTAAVRMYCPKATDILPRRSFRSSRLVARTVTVPVSRMCWHIK
jgi:hypothetical protein